MSSDFWKSNHSTEFGNLAIWKFGNHSTEFGNMPQNIADSTSKHQPPVIIAKEVQHSQEPRSLKFVGVRDFENNGYKNDLESLVKLMRYLNRTVLLVAGLLFLCQIGAAACLCRPVTVLGGTLVSFLFLCQGILGNYVINLISQILLVGYACLSAFVALVGMGAAVYLLFNNFTEACISSFHDDDPTAVTRINIIRALSLVAAVPCVIGAIACFLASTMAAKASKEPTKKIAEPQLYLYLHDNNEQLGNLRRNKNPLPGTIPSAPGHPEVSSNPRAGSPPPSYFQASESFA